MKYKIRSIRPNGQEPKTIEADTVHINSATVRWISTKEDITKITIEEETFHIKSNISFERKHIWIESGQED